MAGYGAEQCSKNAAKWVEKQTAGLVTRSKDYGTGTLEPHAKRTANWIDRTGNARKGLTGGAVLVENEGYISLYIAHTVDYGPYLEKGFAGRYSVLQPTIDSHKDDIASWVKKYWSDKK
jgi:hypothetical protein